MERKIIDIITDAVEGRVPSHQECFFAMMALRNRNLLLQGKLEKIREKINTSKDSVYTAVQANTNRLYEERIDFAQSMPSQLLGGIENPFKKGN
jgi:hypothetical protein